MGYDHIDIEPYHVACKFGEAVVSALGPTIVYDNVPALLVSELAQARCQSFNPASVLCVV